LRSEAGGAPWATPAQLGRTFQGARLYAYACNTMGKDGKVDDAGKLRILAWESFDLLEPGAIVLDDITALSAFVVPNALHIAFDHFVVAAGAPRAA
jgi:hypothetical protein